MRDRRMMNKGNDLVCWEEKNKKKWEMVKADDIDILLLNLLKNENVRKHSIFVIPTTGFVSGIWLWTTTHKSSSIDFWNFFEDYGREYKKPEAKKEDKKILSEIHEKKSDDTKYGWISPDGKYFHCCYQEHVSLADRICFGMTETNNAEKYLEEHGWCKIYKSLFDKKYRVYVGGKYVLTEKQMETLSDMGLENAEDIEKMLIKE